VATCGCGQQDVDFTTGRIVGGEEAVPNSWSMIVSIRLSGLDDHSCSGTILNSSFILTAAHCVGYESLTLPKGVTIAGGMHNRSDPRQIIRHVDRIYVHPLWDSNADDRKHDIAILHLSRPLELDSVTSIARTCVTQINISISTSEYPTNNSELVVIGWGTTQQGSDNLSENLKQLKLFAFAADDPACKNVINDPDVQFCAGRHDSNQGHSDSLSILAQFL
jgi:secreted trypsin-like serine protease